MSRKVRKDVEWKLGPQTILVTGGAGFIGSHLVDELTSRGCGVVILDDFSSGSLKNIETHLKNKETRVVRCGVQDAREVKSALNDTEVVFHLAAVTSVPYSIRNPTITYKVNVRGTRNLLQASIDSRIKVFIYVSTSAVYGEPQYLPIDEAHQLGPKSPYAESKAQAEGYCREFQEKYGLKVVTLRPFNVYGIRQSASEYSGVITKFIANIRENRPPIVYGDGEQTRDFVHVSDVVQALLLSMDTNKAFGQAFNIGTGRAVTINQLCRIVLSKLESKFEPIHRRPRLGDIKHSCAKIEKAQEILGYTPRTLLENGLEELTNKWECKHE